MYILSRVRGPCKPEIDTDLAVTTKNSYIRKTDRMRTQKAKYIYTDTVKFPKREYSFQFVERFSFCIFKATSGEIWRLITSCNYLSLARIILEVHTEKGCFLSVSHQQSAC